MNKSLIRKFVYRPIFLKLYVRQKHASVCDEDHRPTPRHLICFAQWTPQMVLDVLISATNLKKALRGDSHFKKLDSMSKAKIMILEEQNDAILNAAVSKGATLLGADVVNVLCPVVWDLDYNGKIFSENADAIFVNTRTHTCIMRFAKRSSVPVLCMRSRTHASIQSLSTIMSIMEERNTMNDLNLCYIGPPHPVLNSYILLCPMLGANIKYKNCCSKVPTTPLTYKLGEDLSKKTDTTIAQCLKKPQALENAHVIVSGPTPMKKENIPEFTITPQDICCATNHDWLFYHTCPRGEEVPDDLFWHDNARTFTSFQNMQYVSAALLAYTVKNCLF